MEEEFEHNCSLVKLLPKRPSDDELLMLYALYKQATLGDNKTIEPGFFNIKARIKWNSWKSVEGMEKEQAMRHYILKVKELISNI